MGVLECKGHAMSFHLIYVAIYIYIFFIIISIGFHTFLFIASRLCEACCESSSVGTSLLFL